jgi:hypothetical protein
LVADAVDRGAGNVAKSFADFTLILKQECVCQVAETITMRNAAEVTQDLK